MGRWSQRNSNLGEISFLFTGTDPVNAEKQQSAPDQERSAVIQRLRTNLARHTKANGGPSKHVFRVRQRNQCCFVLEQMEPSLLSSR